MNDILRHPILFLLIVAAGFLFIISWALSYHKLRQRGYRSTWIALFIATSCLVGIAAAFAISLACDRIFLVRKLGLSDSNTVFFVQFTISALALLLTAAAILYLLNRILPIRTNRRERGGFRNGWLWFARTLISIGVLLLLFSLALSVRNFHLTEFDKDYRHVVLMSIFGTVYILLGWWYLQRARVSRNIDEVLKSDARPPVLFLRAFKDETRFFDFAYAGQRKSRSLPHLADRGYLNLDLYLSDAIEKLIGHGIPKLPIEGLETVGWSESDGRRRRGRKPTVKKADVKLPREKEKAAAKPARTAKPKADPAVAVARAKPGADELPLAPPPRERARRDEGHARRDEVHARRDEGHHHEPRRDDRSRDPRGRHDDLGPAVLGFGDDIPAFMLVRGRTRHAHVSIDDGEAQA